MHGLLTDGTIQGASSAGAETKQGLRRAGHAAMEPTPTTTPPACSPGSGGTTTTTTTSSSSSLDLQVLSYNVHSCVGTDGVYSPQRIVDVLSAAAAAAPAPASFTTIVALQEIESNGARARHHDRDTRVDNHGHHGNDGNDDDSHAGVVPSLRPIRTRMWSAPHADDQPQFIADGLAAAASSGRGSCEHYHVSFAPAISSVARDRRREWHGHPNDDYYRVGSEMGKFGIALLSQLPIVETRIHRYQRYKRKTRRNAQACLILLPSSSSSHGAKKQQSASKRAIWVVNTHLGCHSGGEQHEQAIELVAFLRSLSQTSSNTAHRSTNATPNTCINIVPLPQIILCGDFNSPPFFRSMEVIRRAGFVDTWEVGRSRNNGRGDTFPSDGRVPGLPYICSLMCCCKAPLLRLDYIWFRDESEKYARKDHTNNREGIDTDGTVLHVKRACVVKNDVALARCASDHLPIACYFYV